MVTSVFGVIFYGFSNQTRLKYNKIAFIRKDNHWEAKINNKIIKFDYFPKEVEDINISAEILNKLKATPEIDITYDINSSFAETMAYILYELKTILEPEIYIRTGFTTATRYNQPIITCEDATIAVPVIYLKDYNITQIHLNNNCIVVYAKSAVDLIKIKDRLLYGILNIIE